MKRVLLILITCLCITGLQAQSHKAKSSSRPKVGVVLGGGGAKGAAHIGALKYLEEMGIPVDYVAGTSMGSIIGGLYAMGYSPEELTGLIASMNWSEYIGNKIDRPMMSKEARERNSTLLLNVPFSLSSLFDRNKNNTFISQLPSAYVNNSSLVNLFNDLCIGYQEEIDFNDLPIPFACVATDLVSGQEVVLRHGSVPTAMRASMAIPGVFSPVQMGDMVLVDGGLVNNFPADVLREMGADIIIGIEITSTKGITTDDLKSLPQVFGRLITNSTSGKREENRAMCDVYIVPDVSGFGMLSFNPEAIDTLVARGYKQASTFHDRLQEIKTELDAAAGHPVSKELHAPRAKNLANEPVLIRSITINNVDNKKNRWLIRKGGLKAGECYSKDDIERAMKLYRGTGCFDEITYQVKESDSLHMDGPQLSDTYDLIVNMTPAKPHVVGLGVRFDTEEGAALLFSLGLNEKKFGGLKFNANIKLSYSTKVNLEATYSVPALANFNIAYDFRNEHFRMLADRNKGVNLHYQQHKVSGYISQFHLLNINTNVGLSYSGTAFDPSSLEGSWLDSTIFVDNRLLTPFVNFEYDNLDDAYFAKRGIFARATFRYHINPRSVSDDRYLDLSYAFQSYITPRNGRFTIIPQVYGRYISNLPYYCNLWNMYGGEIENRHFENQMPFIGFSTVESTSDNVTILRADLRYNFYGKHYLTATYNCLLNWTAIPIIASGIKEPILDAHGAGLKYSYNTRLGPVSLTAHWSRRYSENHFGAYFSFGYTF